MSTPVRLRSLVLILALTAGSVGAIIASPAAQAAPGERPGTVTEYPIPSVPGLGTGSLITGPDGNLWWTGNAFMNKMSPSGPPVTQYPIPDDGTGGPHGITVGPDGNLWFVTNTSVGRVTLEGVVTMFPVPVGRRGLQSLTTGPDGNIWFLYQAAHLNDRFIDPLIGKMDMSGNATVYPLNDESLATQIVAGPDGRIWWSNRNGASIEAIDPSDPVGSFTRYNGNGIAGLYSLTTGSDGNVWFSSSGCCAGIGRMSPTGAVTVYPVNSDGPNAVALGPDGNVWFNGNLNGEAGISRISPDGKVTFVDFGHSGNFPFQPPQAMAAGADGALWYVNVSGDTIGRIALGDNQTTVTNVASGFSNNHIRTPGPGANLKFVFTGPITATATDTTAGMNLFDSGLHSFVTTFSYDYFAAGSYTYADAIQPSHTGTVDVPPTATALYAYAGGVGGNQYRIDWASQAPPAGFVFDVQRQDPGGVFADYLMATTDTNSLDRPYLPAGPYLYRARLHRISDDAVSGWSPSVLVRYGVGAPAGGIL